MLPNARVFIDDKPLKRAAAGEGRLIIYNKPAGEMCTRHDPEGRPTVFKNLPKLEAGRWIAIGRLDFNTQGLLLFTNDGELANTMMHPSNEYKRDYRVRVIGEVTEDNIKQMQEGVSLDDGMAAFDEISASRSAGGKNLWFKVMLKEGRNRIVRRIFESQDITVSRLIRVGFGDIALPRNLETGQWVEVNKKITKEKKGKKKR